MQSKTGGGEGTVKGQKLVIEETSETGKVRLGGELSTFVLGYLLILKLSQ